MSTDLLRRLAALSGTDVSLLLGRLDAVAARAQEVAAEVDTVERRAAAVGEGLPSNTGPRPTGPGGIATGDAAQQAAGAAAMRIATLHGGWESVLLRDWVTRSGFGPFPLDDRFVSEALATNGTDDALVAALIARAEYQLSGPLRTTAPANAAVWEEDLARWRTVRDTLAAARAQQGFYAPRVAEWQAELAAARRAVAEGEAAGLALRDVDAQVSALVTGAGGRPLTAAQRAALEELQGRQRALSRDLAGLEGARIAANTAQSNLARVLADPRTVADLARQLAPHLADLARRQGK